MRSLTLTTLLCLTACGGAGQPPRGPDYTPQNSPEAETGCPKEAAAAKTAREAAVGEDGSAPAETAARAVFTLAECERGRFDLLDLETLENRELVAAVRRQMSTAHTLYEEAMRYRAPRWVVAGLARTGDLVAAYAAKVRKARLPPGVTPADVDEMARALDAEAQAAWGKALDAAEGWPNLAQADAEVKAWVRAACTGAHARARPACR